MTARVLGWVATLILLAVAPGCSGTAGPPVAPVSGKVSFEGKPVAKGTVNFISDAGFGASAPLNSDGTFTLKSEHGNAVPLGNYKLSITPPPPAIDPSLPAGGSAPPVEAPDIPKKYREITTSGLTAVVAAGTNNFTFDMKPQ